MNTFLKHKFGYLEIIGDSNGVSAIDFVSEALHQETPECLVDAKTQLADYFDGQRKVFTFKINLNGTEFQEKCWQALRTIAYGDTASYKEIAIKIGNEKASRAVGMANNKNKLPIVIPCHRIIGSNNKLVGYRGGLELKKYLLELESMN
jgi:methylated-DNA-[protein]-cysteine S-methyltransferase